MYRKNSISLKMAVPVILALLIAGSISCSQVTEVPAPEEILGFKPGADYKLATYEQAIDYWQALAEATPRMKLFEAGKTGMDRTMLYAVISSEDNMARLDHYKEIAEKLSKVKDLTDEEANRLAAEGKAIAWIDAGIHARECAPPQGLIQFAYDLVTGTDAQFQSIRDNVITLLIFPNPDGMTMLSEWYMPNVGTPYEMSPQPWLQNRYAGGNINRDSYMNNLLEVQNITRLINHEWYLVALFDHHQTAPFPARIWIPPAAEPTNPNLHPLYIREKNLIGTGMGFEFDRRGKDGAISRCVFDFIYPGYEDSFVDFFNIPSIMTETAFWGYATPHEYTIDEFPDEFKDFLPSVFYPSPWRPGLWKFSDAVEYTIIANVGFLHTVALYREMFLYGKYKMGKDTIEKFEKEPPYAWIIPQDQLDVPTAAKLVDGMRFAGLDVYQAEEPFDSDGQSYPEGTWVIPMNQPFSRFIKACWEEQVYPDLIKYPKQWQGIVRPQVFEDAYLPPYDMAGWTLPYQFGVKVAAAKSPLEAKLMPLEEAVPPAGKVEGSGINFLLCPSTNNSYKAVNRILKEGGKVQRAQDSFEVEGKTKPAGTIVVQDVDESFMDSLAQEFYLQIRKTGEIPFATSQLQTPKIALYQPWIANSDEGWTRWLLEQYEFPFENIVDADVKAGDLAKKYNVLIIPSMDTDAVVNGHKEGTMPEKYVGGISETGIENIKKFVEEGGTLIALRQGCQFAIDKLGLPVKDAMTELELRGMGHPSGESGEAIKTKFACPGSILLMKFDSKHPVGYGMPEEAPGMFYQSTAFDVDVSSGAKVISSFAERDVLLSGYLVGEEYIGKKAAAVDVPRGKGRVILIGFGVQNRAQPVGTFKLFFNSILYGATE